MTGGVGKSLKTVGIVAGAAALGGLALFGKAMKDSIKSASEHQQAYAQTVAGLRSTGGIANVTAGHITGLADKIEKMSGVDDLAVQSSENLLITFTKIRNEVGKGNDIFDQATMAVADLSTRMGGDMQGASIQVGKALNDPIKGITALTRVGVSFTAAQKESIKTLVKHGDTLGAQKMILKELQTEFGGSAKAAGSTFAGQIKILKSHLDDLEQSIGEKIIPVLSKLVAWAIANWPAFEAAARTALGGVRDAFVAIADAIRPHMDQIRAVIEGVVSVISTLFGFLSNNIETVKQVAAAIAVGAAAFVVLTTAVRIYTIAQAILNAVMTANPIALVIIAIAALVVGLTLLYQRSDTARAIMQTAFAVIKAAAGAAFDFITNTVIPNAIAAWNRFGPSVVATLSAAASAIKTVVSAIATIVEVVVDQIQAHWEAVWKLIGPVVVAMMQIVKTAVQTTLNVISGIVRVFAALLRGDWSGAWDALKGIVSDVLAGVVSIIGSALRGLAGTAKALAGAVGEAIAAGIKSAVVHLAGLAGDIAAKIQGAVNQLVGSAFTFARSVGFAIADGIISGLGNLASRLLNALKDSVLGPINWIKNHAGSTLQEHTAYSLGQPMMQGIIDGVEQTRTRLEQSLYHTVRGAVSRGGEAVGEATKGTTAIFEAWATNVATRMDAVFKSAQAKIDSEYARAKAKLDAWKAASTPTEALLAAMQAQAARSQVELAVSAASAALDKLKVKQAADWAALMKTQADNMKSLQASLQQSKDSALLSGNTFTKTLAANATDPLAIALLNAQKAFDATKAAFDAGLATQQAFIDAANVLDDAKLAAAEDNNATTLLDQYNTWQAAIAQEAAGGAAITAQVALDGQAQQTLRDQFATDQQTAAEAMNSALLGRQKYYLEQQAITERTAIDTAAAELNTALTNRYNRVTTHLKNVQTTWETHTKKLIDDAKKDGKKLGSEFADGLDAAAPEITKSLKSVAALVAKYLKLQSPAELGPLSDLDTWWRNLAPTLVASLDTGAIKAALTDATTPGLGRVGGRSAGQGALALNDQGLIEKMSMLIDEFRKAGAGGGSSPVTVIATGGAEAAVYAARR